MEQWQERHTIYQGPVFEVQSGTVRLGNGGLALRDVVIHQGGVTIAAAVDGNVIMIRQFRVAIETTLLELPAGMVEGEEDPRERAAKELREETGYHAGRLELVADYYVSPGYTTERMRVYLADDLTFVGQALDGDEQIEVVSVPLAEAKAMLSSGRLQDAKTIIGLRELVARLEI